jgi:hypothetical protein
MSSEPGTASVPMTWTYGTSTNFASVAVALQPFGGGSSGTANTMQDRLVISSNGAVGVGNSAPTGQFQVGDGSSGFIVDDYGRIGIGTESPTDFGNATTKLQIEGGNLLIGKASNTDAGTPGTTWNKVSPTTPGTMNTTAGATSIDGLNASAVYNGKIYVGTNLAGNAEVYRYDGGTTWTRVTGNTPGTIGTQAGIDEVSTMTVFNGHLYIGVREAGGASIFRYDGGTTWTEISQTVSAGQIASAGRTGIDGIGSMVVWNGAMYVGTTESNAAEIYRFDGCASGTWPSCTTYEWTQINTTDGTFGTIATQVDGIYSMAVYNNSLYVGTQETDGTDEGDVLRFDGPSTFTSVINTPGTIISGDTSGIDGIYVMTTYNGALYIGTRQADNSEVYRYDSGTGWQHVTPNASSVETKDQIDAMIVYNGRLYMGVSESSNAETWRYNGVDNSWTLVSNGGGNYVSGASTGIDNSGTIQVLGGYLYQMTGDTGSGQGAEVYRYQDTEGQSNALLFRAASDETAGVSDSDSFPNIGAIRFMAEQSAVQNANSGNQTGMFVLTHALSTSAGAYDIAEDYATRDESLKPGEVVVVDPNESGFVRRATSEYQNGLVGIYSENPGFRLSQADDSINGAKAIPVALAGRVQVDVASSSAAIQAGDYVTSSNEAGKVMKATRFGRMVGKALENWEPASGKTKLLVYVSLTDADPNNVLSQIVVNEDGSLKVASMSASAVTLDPDLQIDGKEVNGSLEMALLATSDSLTEIRSEIDTLKTDVLSVTAKADALDTRLTDLEIKEASNAAMLDNTASAAATALSNTLSLSDQIASVTASLNQQIADLVAQMNASQSQVQSPIAATESATPESAPNSSALTNTDMLIATDSATFNNIAVVSTATISGDLTAYTATVQDTFKSFGQSFLADTTIAGTVMVTGNTMLEDTNVAGVLTVDERVNVGGTLNITSNSISVLGTSVTSTEEPTDGILFLQNSPLANLIDLFSGKTTIDKDGNIKTKGNVEIEGDLMIKGGITTKATAGEAITAGDAVYVSDAEEVMKADATDPNKADVIGIAANDAALGEEVTVVIGGKAKGFTSLEIGKRYYLTDNAGITSVVPTDILSAVSVGVAFSETELLIQISAGTLSDATEVTTP